MVTKSFRKSFLKDRETAVVANPPANFAHGCLWPIRVCGIWAPSGFEKRVIAYWDSVMVVEEGTVEITGTRRAKLSPGEAYRSEQEDMVLIRASVGARWRWIDWLRGPPQGLVIDGPCEDLELCRRAHNSLFELIAAGAHSHSPARALSLAWEFLHGASAAGRTRVRTAGNEDLVERATSAFHAGMADGQDLRGLARQVGSSPSGLRRAFAAVVRKSPKEACFEMQMTRARRLLFETDFTLGFIARECGFNDEKTFIRRFREAHGQPPGQWRRGKALP